MHEDTGCLSMMEHVAKLIETFKNKKTSVVCVARDATAFSTIASLVDTDDVKTDEKHDSKQPRWTRGP